MRIAAHLYALPPDRQAGADIMSLDLLQHLAAAGHEVTAYTRQARTVREVGQIRVEPLTQSNRRPACDVIYTHPDIGAMPYQAARAMGVPVIGVVHNVGVQNRRAVKWPHGLLVWNAHGTRLALGGEGGIVVRPPIPEPCGTVEFGARDAVVCVNLSPEKGGAVFWDLATRLPHRRFLGVMGAHGVQMVQHPDLGPLPNVEVWGPVLHSQMWRVWAQAAVLVAPSEAESWGMAAVEALTHGVPVIAHPTGGLEESLGSAGVFHDRRDVDAWERSVRRVFSGGVDRGPLVARAVALRDQVAADRVLWVDTVNALV